MSVSEELMPNQVVLGERNYEAATALIIAGATRELKIFDPDLSRGGYQSLQLHDLLESFLAKDRLNRVIIILHESHFFIARCSRLTALMKRYTHAMTVYLTDERAQVAQDAFVLADSGDYLHRFHVDHARFKYVHQDEVAAKSLHERFDQLLDVTSSTLSITTTGL
ncbi:MAG: hypothetical protein Q8J65_05270 [Nitrosomonadales bacterium]|nr:hypothetical protein [Nitrosomonadales bacterium]